MKRIIPLLLVCAGAVFAQRSETVFFRAIMLPSNEVPAIDINASGAATIRAHVVRNANNEIVSGSVDFIISYTFPGAQTFTGLHIHRGVAGENGSVTINTGLSGAAPFEDTTGRAGIERQAQVLATDANGLATVRDMMDNPAGFYVNLHTTVYSGGVIRGQLMRPETVTLMTQLSPRNEVPAIANSNATGLASIVAMRTFDGSGRVNSGMVIFEVDYILDAATNLTGLHIHNGPAGFNAGVVINTGLATTRTPDNARGRLVFPVEIDMARQPAVDALNGLFTDPAGHYANLHTTESPGGLIRGQLRRADSNNFAVTMSTANEVPAITGLDATGAANVTINTIRGNDGGIIAGRVAFDVNHRFPGATTFQGLHIHDQVAGQNGGVTIDSGLNAANTIVSANGFGNIYRVVNVMAANGLATLNSLVANPDRHYVNLHTSVNTGGAVRAQIGEQYRQGPVIGDVASLVVDSGQRDVAPGGLAAIWGLRFAHVETDVLSAETTRLPASLNGVEVTIAGRTAPIVTVAPGYAAVQVPFETPAGRQPVIVRNGNGAGEAMMVNVAAAAPGIFHYIGDWGQVVKASDVTWVTADNPAAANDDLWVWATGLGQTTPALTTGAFVTSETNRTQTVTATIGARAATVSGSIAAPGIPGLYIVTLRVPAGLTPGNQPLQLRVGNAASNTVTLVVR